MPVVPVGNLDVDETGTVHMKDLLNAAKVGYTMENRYVKGVNG